MRKPGAGSLREKESFFLRKEQREKLKAYVRNRYGFYGYGFYSVLWKETGELAAWAGFQERQYQGKQVLELGYLTAPSFRRQGIASEPDGTSVGRDGGSHRRNKGFYFLSSGKILLPDVPRKNSVTFIQNISN